MPKSSLIATLAPVTYPGTLFPACLDALENHGGASCPKGPQDAPPDFAPPSQPPETAHLSCLSLNKVTSWFFCVICVSRLTPTRVTHPSQTTPPDASQKLDPTPQPQETEQLKMPSKSAHDLPTCVTGLRNTGILARVAFLSLPQKPRTHARPTPAVPPYKEVLICGSFS